MYTKTSRTSKKLDNYADEHDLNSKYNKTGVKIKRKGYKSLERTRLSLQTIRYITVLKCIFGILRINNFL
jgi:hypothetical protein